MDAEWWGLLIDDNLVAVVQRDSRPNVWDFNAEFSSYVEITIVRVEVKIIDVQWTMAPLE